jgi:hypothetical protein
MAFALLVEAVFYNRVEEEGFPRVLFPPNPLPIITRLFQE